MELIGLISSDARRYSTKPWRALGYPSFWASSLYRLSHRLVSRRRFGVFEVLAYVLTMSSAIIFRVEISPRAEFAEGLYIPHIGGIVVGSRVICGRNITIHQGVTLGVGGRGARQGEPTIGNNVFIGAGAKVLGAIKVGDNVAIGANSVVIHDVPSGVSCAGVPARIIGGQGVLGLLGPVPSDSNS